MTTYTWKRVIEEEMEINEDIWSNVIGCTISKEDLNTEFEDWEDLKSGGTVKVWTMTHIYFDNWNTGPPVIRSISRDPWESYMEGYPEVFYKTEGE